MARIDNLENFLNDVALAIKNKKEYAEDTKIPAANFDTEISSIKTRGNYQNKSVEFNTNTSIKITADEGYDALGDVDVVVNVETGSDTSDATATSHDILYPKTAYLNNGKNTGSIMPYYEYEYEPRVITNSDGKTIMDISTELGLAIIKNVGKLSIYNYDGIALLNELYSIDMDTTNMTKAVFGYNGKDIAVSYGAPNVSKVVIYDLETKTEIYNNSFLANNHNNTCLVEENPVLPGVYGVVVLGMYTYSSRYKLKNRVYIIKHDESGVSTKLDGGDITTTKEYYDAGAGLYWPRIAWTLDGESLCANATAGSSGTSAEYNITANITLDLTSISFSAKTSSDNNYIPLGRPNTYLQQGKYVVVGSNHFELPLNTGTSMLQKVGCWGEHMYVYTYIDSKYKFIHYKLDYDNMTYTTISEVETGKSSNVPNGFQYSYIPSTKGFILDGMLYNDKPILKSMTRHSSVYRDTSDSDITENDVLIGKFAYGPEGKIEGTLRPSGATEIVASYDYKENPSDSSYTFNLNSSNYYESSNKGVHSTYSYIKLTFLLDTTQDVNISYINSGESNYDYGIFSNIDKDLSYSINPDTSSELVKKNCKGESSTDVKTLVYSNVPAGVHYITVKYRKDGSSSSGNDSLQFKFTNITLQPIELVYSVLAFGTIEEMQAYENPVERNIAVIYDNDNNYIYLYTNGEWTDVTNRPIDKHEYAECLTLASSILNDSGKEETNE